MRDPASFPVLALCLALASAAAAQQPGPPGLRPYAGRRSRPAA
jgi:hypothetical protein